VIGNDGWESVATDIIGIHDYDTDPARIARRYFSREVPQLLKRERPGGRAIVLEGRAGDHPIVLSEFGGIAILAEQSESWGYGVCKTADEFAAHYRALLGAVRSLDLIAGFCYTQLTDTYQEANGLLSMDRTPKIPIEIIAEATAGARDGWAREELSPERRLTPTGPPEPDTRTTPDSVFLAADGSSPADVELDPQLDPAGVLEASQRNGGNR
jgi:hypothetical protein